MTSANTPANSRSLMKFNLTAGIGESRVVINCSATLYVQSSGGGADVTFQHNRNDNWNESTVTWNNFVGDINGTSEAVLYDAYAGGTFTTDGACDEMAYYDYRNASDRILSMYLASFGGTPVSYVTFGTKQSSSPILTICSDDCVANFTLESNTTYCYNSTAVVQDEYYVDQNQCNSSYLSYSSLVFTECSGGTPDCVNATCVCTKTAYDNWIVDGNCEYACGIEPVGLRGVDETTCTYSSASPMLSGLTIMLILSGLILAIVGFIVKFESSEDFLKKIIAIIILISITVAMIGILSGLL